MMVAASLIIEENMMDMIVNSQFIIELRKSKAWSQQHLAEVSGLSLRTVQRIEKSSSGAPDSIKAIAMAFGLVPADLMTSPEPEATDSAAAKKSVDKAVDAKLRRLIAMVAGIVVTGVLGISIWLGSSSFYVGANGHSDGAANQSMVSQTNAEPPQQKEIVEAALSWLGYVDSGDYKTGWQQSDPMVHNQVTAEQWQGAVQSVRGLLGEVTAREVYSLQVSTSLPGLPDGEYAILVLSSQFDAKAESFETVAMSKSTGTWRPMGYFVR